MTEQTARHTYSMEPLNLGAPPVQPQRDPITPVERFFVRNHGTLPSITPESYRLCVDGLVGQPLTLSLDELARFPAHTVTATLQCAGQRRRELTEFKPIDANEIVWDVDAISTAVWTGARLRDVLQAAEPQAEAKHIAFLGLDKPEKAREGFGGSIPLDKALEADVLLAYAMNGAPLSPAHGYPLRALVPGYIGARSVKWLGRITLQQAPSANYYQAHAYKLFPPSVQAHTADWDEGKMLGSLPINSFITTPRKGERLAEARLTVQGVAVPGGDAVIERVELSCDGGETWQTTTITSPQQQWTWCFWEMTCDLPRGSHELVVRAFDSAGHVQPEQLADVWNFKGYVNNAYQRVRIERI